MSPEAVRGAVVFSSDQSLGDLVIQAVGNDWTIYRCFNSSQVRGALVKPRVRIVLFDDDGFDAETGGWILDQVRRYAPAALLAYVAARHSFAVVRRARSHNAHYHLSRPLEHEQIIKVIQAFAAAALREQS